MAILTSSPKGAVLYHTLSVRLPDGGMARLTGHVQMGPFQNEAGIPVVVEAIGTPFDGRAMTAVTMDAVFSIQLTAMNIFVAGHTGLRRSAVEPRRCTRFVRVARALFLVAGRAVSLGVGPGEKVSRALMMIVRPDTESLAFTAVADGTIISAQLAFKLQPMGVFVTGFTLARCVNE